MPTNKRLSIAGILLSVLLVIYGMGRYYSPLLVAYVVEQALVQKAPSGTEVDSLRLRLHGLLAGLPDQDSRMEMLIRISQYLEKVQRLTPEELEALLTRDTATGRQEISCIRWNLFQLSDVNS